MKKNKKLLALLLALNAITSVFAGAEEISKSNKHNRLYTNMIRNVEKGKSNGQNYKLIKDVLNKKNKELKDLYAQGDYIVKPEYLEWQIFFTGFAAEKKER